MMWPRLVLLRDLLREDGVIFVSIDDHEAHHLRAILDEIFGEDNFIAQLVWEKGRKNDAKFFSVGHEYILVYARSVATLRQLKTIWREPKPGAKEVWEQYAALRKQFGADDKAIEDALQEWYRQLPDRHPSKALSRYKHIDKNGPWRDRDISWPGGGGPRYDVIHPITKRPCKVPERGWGFATSEAMQQQIDLGLVEFREDHTQPPFRKAHLRPVFEELDEENGIDLNGDEEPEAEEPVVVGLQVMPSVIYKQSQVAVKYLRSLMGGKVFDNPKDYEVLARLIRYVTASDHGDIILDSFAGSGTTGHAVLAANEDGGNRRFILVEQEDYADTITAKRIRKVIRGVRGAKDDTLRKGLGGAFSYFELGPALDDEAVLSGNTLPSYIDLARYVFFTATGEQLDDAQVNESRYYLGESRLYQVYLLYQPNVEFLKTTPLNLTFAERLPKSEKARLVIASHKYLDDDRLREMHIEFCQLPFAIYRFKA